MGSGVADLVHADRVVATVAHLGFPAYFPTILGPWKVAAVVTLLAPRLTRVKEWAYAGIVFDLTGGAFAHASSGDPLANIAVPVFLLALAAASYLLRPESRRLRETEPREPAAHPLGAAVPVRA
jgi:hypothetical protein